MKNLGSYDRFRVDPLEIGCSPFDLSHSPTALCPSTTRTAMTVGSHLRGGTDPALDISGATGANGAPDFEASCASEPA